MAKFDDGSRQASVELQEFNLFAQFLQDACGISLGPNKQYLVSTRINRILSDNRIDSLTELLVRLGESSNSGLRKQIIDAMTTNETYWFRDAYPFEYLKDTLIPQLIAEKRNNREFRIWSAACSTGQEPYSLSMAIEEYKQKNFGYFPLPIKILATDLSGTALDAAEKGVYDKLSMARGLTSERMDRFFRPHTDSTWRVKDEVKQRVEFRSLNLLESFHLLGKFDIIFCRNVLIYFGADLKRDILTRLHRALNPQGLLCLGSSEGLSNIPAMFEMVQCNPGIMYRAK
jgi:chemotaxis protein methyltransferase CheR